MIAGPGNVMKIHSTLLRRLRLYAVNTFIALIVLLLLIDACPNAVPALHAAIQPFVQSLGLRQPWTLFAPNPDSTNTRLRAEITYRDGVTQVWQSPDWSTMPAWQRWKGVRHWEFLDHLPGQEDEPVWPGWARHLARSQRPDYPEADRGAEVKIIVEQSPIRNAAFKPWEPRAKPPVYEPAWTLTVEKLP